MLKTGINSLRRSETSHCLGSSLGRGVTRWISRRKCEKEKSQGAYEAPDAQDRAGVESGRQQGELGREFGQEGHSGYAELS